MIRRRLLASIAGTLLLARLGVAAGEARASTAPPSGDALDPVARLRALEHAARGRLGVCIVDTASKKEYGYRADERFMMLSSFKLLACALVLHRVDSGTESLERNIAYSRQDLLPWSPLTEKHADGDGMTLGALCEATITTSDNAAANLILASYGGPAALTAFVRRLGDETTRLDRIEPELNVPHSDSERDTTSPRAMVRSMARVLLGDALSAPSRQQLQQWMLDSTTGAKRLRAGLPGHWKVGDKTGTNKTDANDIAVIWPPHRPPLLVAAYLADSQAEAAQKDATIAAVGTLVRDLVG